MNRFALRLSAPLTAAALLTFALPGVSVSSVQAAESCPSLWVPPGVERRIADKASEGVDQLRQYLFINRAIYQLDIYQVGAWLDARQAGACR